MGSPERETFALTQDLLRPLATLDQIGLAEAKLVRELPIRHTFGGERRAARGLGAADVHKQHPARGHVAGDRAFDLGRARLHRRALAGLGAGLPDPTRRLGGELGLGRGERRQERAGVLAIFGGGGGVIGEALGDGLGLDEIPLVRPGDGEPELGLGLTRRGRQHLPKLGLGGVKTPDEHLQRREVGQDAGVGGG
jgi:hypothetical protein